MANDNVLQKIYKVSVDRDWGLRGQRRYFSFFCNEKITNSLLLEKIKFLKPDFEFNPQANGGDVFWQEIILSEIGKGFAVYEETR